MKVFAATLALGLLAGCASDGNKEALIEDRSAGSNRPAQSSPLPTTAVPGMPNGPKSSPAVPSSPSVPGQDGQSQVETHPMPNLNVVEKPIGTPSVPNGLVLPDGDGKVVRLEIKDTNGERVPCLVQFEFDSPAIDPKYTALLEQCAESMKINPSAFLILQGNTDERGSREYNLALGQKRANSVLAALKLLGVAENQMEAVSLGEEKPVSEGHDESAWAQNRRVEFFYESNPGQALTGC